MLEWDGGRAGKGRGLRGMCWGGQWSWGVCVCVGLLRIDQALEEANCATFEDEGTIMPLGSVSRRRGSQTTRGKRSDFCTGNPERLLPRPDKSVEVPRARPNSGPRTQARGPPSAWPSPADCPWASSSTSSGSWCSRAAKNKRLVRIQQHYWSKETH